MRTTRIYLAGKISKYDWRQKIVNIRNSFDCEIMKTDFIDNELQFNEYTYITGPFFLSCDHGCFHGECNHGVGLHPDEYSCAQAIGPNFTEDEVINICKEQIYRSDILVAYINDNTCYGTLVEIGLAKNAGKKIAIIFDNEEIKRDMWFAAGLSDWNMCLNGECSSNIFKNFEVHEGESILDIRDKIIEWKKINRNIF